MLDYDSLQTSKTEDPTEPPETDDSQPKQSQSFLDKGKENYNICESEHLPIYFVSTKRMANPEVFFSVLEGQRRI